MNAPAAESTKIDHAFATQCLVSMIDRTTPLLTIAARGKGWDAHRRYDIEAIEQCAKKLLETLGLTSDYRPFLSSGNTPYHGIRMLGELQVAVSEQLSLCAQQHARPETPSRTFDADKMRHLYALAVEFVASTER